MTVKELFRKSDAGTVFHAYTLVRPVFDDLDNHTMQEQAMLLKKLREHIEEVCSQIGDCEIQEVEKSKTVFVIGRTRTEWGKSYILDMECFTTYDEEAQESVKTNFTMWNDEGDTRLEFYGLDFEKLDVIAGYTIAAPSVLEYGIDVCCAVILRDIFVWGITEEQHEERYVEVTRDLDAGIKDYEAGELMSADEVFALLEEELYKDASEDEKEHRKYEHEYENNVEEIESRYREKICNEDHQRFIDMVRREYDSNRVV